LAFETLLFALRNEGMQLCAESQYCNYRSDLEFESSEELMQFRLTYEGPLKPSGNNNRNTANKHAIRRALHPQLKKLWETEGNLRKTGQLEVDGIQFRGQGKGPQLLKFLAENRPLKDYRFVPLVCDELCLWCGLDILYLRPSPPGQIFQQGDIDNRIKTLFDALRRPTQLQELGTSYPPPGLDETPFYVLLDNDSLVAKLSVDTDMMLEPLIGGIPEETDARLIITVTLRPLIGNGLNTRFG
jgi:hypothetical protein